MEQQLWGSCCGALHMRLVLFNTTTTPEWLTSNVRNRIKPFDRGQTFRYFFSGLQIWQGLIGQLIKGLLIHVSLWPPVRSPLLLSDSAKILKWLHKHKRRCRDLMVDNELSDLPASGRIITYKVGRIGFLLEATMFFIFENAKHEFWVCHPKITCSAFQGP